jgi:small basic protein
VATVAAQVLSFRRASGERRQQLKWLGAGGAVAIAVLFTTIIWSSAPGFVGNVLLPIALMALPLSIGVGILRYRLYEIDRLVSRTLAYAILTGLLVGVFIGLVALSTDTLALSGRVGVAASTLAAAALFNPLRKRIQHLVDRRFNRARYDAEATVAAFTARLRDAVELDTIRADLLAAVTRAVEPTHASLWIKP